VRKKELPERKIGGKKSKIGASLVIIKASLTKKNYGYLP